MNDRFFIRMAVVSVLLAAAFLACSGSAGSRFPREVGAVSAYSSDVLQGDIVVRDGQTLTIQDTVLGLNGSVIVKDQARLTLSNVTLSIVQTVSSPSRIRVEGEGRIDVLDCQITSDGELQFEVVEAGLAFVDNSSMSSVVFHLGGSPVLIVYSSVFSELVTGETARINVYYSTIVDGITFEYTNPVTSVQMAGLQPGYMQAFNFWPYPTMHMLHVDVGGWSFLVHQKALLDVADSTLKRLTVLFEDDDVEVDSWLPGYFSDWRLRFLNLRNSTISDGWGVSPDASNIQVSNSQVRIGPYATGVSHLVVEASQVDDVFLQGYVGRVELEDVVLKGEVEFEESMAELSGSFRVEQVALTQFRSSTITRTFEVIAHDPSHVGLRGVNVDLTRDGSTVAHSTTGSSGAAMLAYTFTEADFDAELTVEASYGEARRTCAFGMLSGSPVELTLDTVPPSVTVFSPVNGSTVVGVVLVDVEVVDDVGVARVEVTLDGVSLVNLTAPPYRFDLNALELANGQHLLAVLAFDGDGNVASALVVLYVENVAPTPTPQPTEIPPTTTMPTTTSTLTPTSPPPADVGWHLLVATLTTVVIALSLSRRKDGHPSIRHCRP